MGVVVKVVLMYALAFKMYGLTFDLKLLPIFTENTGQQLFAAQGTFTDLH